MTERKPGDWALVTLHKVHGDSSADLGPTPHGGEDRVFLRNLSPLPEPDKITALERAVVEASVRWSVARLDAKSQEAQAYSALIATVSALREARKPKDPNRELLEAVVAYRADLGFALSEAGRRVAAAVNALCPGGRVP